MSISPGFNARDCEGRTARRLKKKLEALGLQVSHITQNTRRLSHYNDEIAWDAEVLRSWGQGWVRAYSWQTMSDLVRSPTISLSSDEDGNYEIASP